MFKEKHQFYVEFLGWVECKGLRGRQITDPVIQNLRRKHNKLKNSPKLTIQLNKKELKISKDEEKKKKKIKIIKFPPIPTRDVTYVTQAYSERDGRAEDIVACIYLGLVPRTNKYIHVHVYRFDSAETASKFVRFLDHIVAANSDRIREIEHRLAASGDVDTAYPHHQVNPRLTSSDGMSEPHTGGSAADSATSTYSSDSDEIAPDMQSLKDVIPFESVTDELKHRLRLTTSDDGPPILLPPKDYDTVVRRHGNLDRIEKRKCLQLNIVGESGLPSRFRNGSGESGIDVSSPSKSEGKIPGVDSPISSPSTSPSSAKDFDYPRKSSGSPHRTGSDHRHSPLRNTSFSSAYSSHSYKSDLSSHSNVFNNGPSSENTVIYKGVKNVGETVIPPADYDPNETVAIRQKQPRWRAKDLSRSVSGEGYERASKMRNAKDRHQRLSARDSNGPAMYTDVYAPRGEEFRVRRVHSMYK